MEKAYNILKLVIWVLVFVILILGAYLLYRHLAPMYSPDTLATQPSYSETEPDQSNAQLAPDFTVVDLSGKEYKLSDFRGKCVVLNFWASWCGPCKSEMPDFQEAYLKYGEQIHFLMVNLTDGSQETVSSASGYIEAQGYTFPVYYDTSSSGAIAYGVTGVPVTYFIDADGYFVAWGQGALSADALQRGIDMLLETQK